MTFLVTLSSSDLPRAAKSFPNSRKKLFFFHFGNFGGWLIDNKDFTAKSQGENSKC